MEGMELKSILFNATRSMCALLCASDQHTYRQRHRSLCMHVYWCTHTLVFTLLRVDVWVRLLCVGRSYTSHHLQPYRRSIERYSDQVNTKTCQNKSSYKRFKLIFVLQTIFDWFDLIFKKKKQRKKVRARFSWLWGCEMCCVSCRVVCC